MLHVNHMVFASSILPCPSSSPSSSRTAIASCSSTRHFFNFGFNPKWLPINPNQSRTLSFGYRYRPVSFCALKDVKSSSSPSRNGNAFEFDVVIIGAGIIGLTIARQFLIGSDLSVAVVDKAVPCSGATGAGENVRYEIVILFVVCHRRFLEIGMGLNWSQGRGIYGWRTNPLAVTFGNLL